MKKIIFLLATAFLGTLITSCSDDDGKQTSGTSTTREHYWKLEFNWI